MVGYAHTPEDRATPLEMLKQLQWNVAWGCYLGISKEEITEDEEAVNLWRRLEARMEDRLSRNAKVPAMALTLYEKALAEQLPDAFAEIKNTEALRKAQAAQRRQWDEAWERLNDNEDEDAALTDNAHDNTL